MCDKKKELNLPKQTPHGATYTHTHAYTHTEKKKNTLFQPEGGWGGRLKTPTRFSCEKNKSCHWPLSNVDPKLCVRSVGSASSPNLPLSLSTLSTSLAICYLCNVYVWMVNICKYPTPYPVDLYAHLSHLHFPLRFGSIYAAATPDPLPPIPIPLPKLIGNSTLSNL